jgi:hypothetical protein
VVAALSSMTGAPFPGITGVKNAAVKAQAPKAGFLTVVVDADEYEEALRDPRVHRGNREADEFLERLEREGRSF